MTDAAVARARAYAESSACTSAVGPKVGFVCWCEQEEGAVVEHFLDGKQAAVNLERWVSK